MHRIDGPGATTDHKFTDGDPVGAVPATLVTDEWLNAVQEEVSAVIESTGVALNKASSNQLLVAINKKILDAIPAAPDLWAMQPIGVPIPLFTHLAGVTTPPTNKAYRYISLTAADAYNAGALTGEVISGAAPLLQASAVVSLAGSPLNGLTVSLINTERRVIRAGLSGQLDADQSQGHRHAALASSFVNGGSLNAAAGSAYAGGVSVNATTGGPVTDTVNGAPRFGDETRAKSIGATYYLRIR